LISAPVNLYELSLKGELKMSEGDPYINLRGGVLSSVTGLMPSTISSWELQLGQRKGEGHPRYSLADVVAVVLMKELALAAKLQASRASYIVAQLQPKLPQLIARIRSENANKGKWCWSGGPYVLVGGGRHGRTPNEGLKVDLIEEADLAKTVREAKVASLIIVPIRRIIAIAMLALTNDNVEQ
jgi:hypothetical protein